MTPTERRDRIFAGYERGIMTASEVSSCFIDLVVDCDSDDEAVALCDGTPQWFRDQLRASLERWAESEYFVCSFGIGDNRTPEQVKADARRVQSRLRPLAPKLITAL